MIDSGSTSWDKPVGKIEPIGRTGHTVIKSGPFSVDDPVLVMGEIAWVAPQSPYLDTLIFREDLNKAQIKMAKRAIENLKGMIRTGWIREG